MRTGMRESTLRQREAARRRRFLHRRTPETNEADVRQRQRGRRLGHQVRLGSTADISDADSSWLLQHYCIPSHSRSSISSVHSSTQRNYPIAARELGRLETRQEAAVRRGEPTDATANHVISSAMAQNMIYKMTIMFRDGCDAIKSVRTVRDDFVGISPEPGVRERLVRERLKRVIARTMWKACTKQLIAASRTQRLLEIVHSFGKPIVLQIPAPSVDEITTALEEIDISAPNIENQVTPMETDTPIAPPLIDAQKWLMINANIEQSITAAFRHGGHPEHLNWLLDIFNSYANVRLGDRKTNLQIRSALDLPETAEGNVTAWGMAFLEALQRYWPDLDPRHLFTLDLSGRRLSSSREEPQPSDVQ